MTAGRVRIDHSRSKLNVKWAKILFERWDINFFEFMFDRGQQHSILIGRDGFFNSIEEAAAAQGVDRKSLINRAQDISVA